MNRREERFLRLDTGSSHRGLIAAIVLVAVIIGGTLAFTSRRGAAGPSGSTTPSDNIVLQLTAAERIETPFVKREDATAALGATIEVPPKAGTDPGALEIGFTTLHQGRYNVWIRAYWGTDGEDACSNSVRIQLDEHPPVLVQDATYRVWHWIMVRFRPDRDGAVTLEEGKHKFVFQNREDGIKIDQVLITPWQEDEFDRFVPQGILEVK